MIFRQRSLLAERTVMASPADPTTVFRTWMQGLLNERGDKPGWPKLLCWMLEATFLHEQQKGHSYLGPAVFIDRDDHDPSAARVPEKKSVYQLYHRCHGQTAGIFTVGDDRYWLLGYEWPNQGKARGQRADLVGIRADGGLVVFEGKLGNNSYTPLTALLEGLDYLACLMSEQNFGQILSGFQGWRNKPGRLIPTGFESVEPKLNSRPGVVVLAPQEYFDLHTRSHRGNEWPELVAAGRSMGTALSLDFAITDFSGATGSWVAIS
jgi:hypothetical protein